MKCRDGCENDRVGLELICRACWNRVPSAVRADALNAARVNFERARQVYLTWLAADDKRSK
jgi:hypothetical protein